MSAQPFVSDPQSRAIHQPNYKTITNKYRQSVPPRKIALMVEPTPFTYVCGYSNRYNEMLRYLKKAGDEVNIVTTDDHKDPPKEAFGYPIEHTLGFRFPLYDHVVVSFDLPEIKGLRMMEALRPDVIHISSPGFLLFAALFYARLMKIPLLMSYHTHLPNYAVKVRGRQSEERRKAGQRARRRAVQYHNYQRLFRSSLRFSPALLAPQYLGYIPGIEEFAWMLLRFAHKRADLTLTTSPQLKKELEEHGIPRVDVWRKGIDTVRFDPKFKSAEMREKMSDGNPDDFLMVYVGRLGAEKRVADIKPILEKMGPNTRLAIVGAGPAEAELKKIFKGTNTVFTGQISGDELSSAFASADAFCMPSDSETLGFVVLESMASGVPVVGANAGGIPSIIHHRVDSYLAEPGDTNEFVKYLSIIRENKHGVADKMKITCREEAQKHSWEAATSVLRNVQYELAIQNFKSRSWWGYGGPNTNKYGKAVKQKFSWLFQKMKFVLTLGFLRKNNTKQLKAN